MAKKKIVVEFDESGNCALDGHIGGPECDTILSEIEKALGITLDRRRKREYHEVVRNRKRERQ